MSDKQTPTVCLIIIGNEILSGRTQDTNLAYIGRRLNELGLELREVRVVLDVEADIVKAVNECRATYDYVFTTGGIGPTHDDITARCIAKAFGVPIERNPHAAALISQSYKPEDLNEARLSMADMPKGATLIENPVSMAPGFQYQNVFVLAGIPSVMQAMFESVKYKLTGGAPISSRTVSAFLGEGVIAQGLGELQERYPDLEIGSYPFFRSRRFGISLVVRGTDTGRLDQAAAELKDLIRSLGGKPVEDTAA